jgi:hypothetical protein
VGALTAAERGNEDHIRLDRGTGCREAPGRGVAALQEGNPRDRMAAPARTSPAKSVSNQL